MSSNRVFRIIRDILCIGALLSAVQTSAGSYQVGQVKEVDVASRVIVIGDRSYRLGTPLRFSSEFPSEDLVIGVRAGSYVRFNVSPERGQQTITELHVFSNIPE
jgi:hypothetical protein